MKKFIITIDTEGDNLWQWREGDSITTKNVGFLERFQKLANKYNFKPVWLTNYEMIMDDNYLSFIKKVISSKTGEIGAHLHAWNNPPLYQLVDYYESAPYLIEYPNGIMTQKLEELTNAIYSRTGVMPVSHRAGRWAMNDDYFEILVKLGYLNDCSFTPYCDWRKNTGRTKMSKGSNYSKIRNKKYVIQTRYGSINEFPTTIFPKKILGNGLISTIKNVVKRIIGKRDTIWLRPNGHNLNEMIQIVNKVRNNKDINYLMFMIHSSELMPGGSPSFKDDESIEKMYKDIGVLFDIISKDFEGSTLQELGDSPSGGFKI